MKLAILILIISTQMLFGDSAACGVNFNDEIQPSCGGGKKHKAPTKILTAKTKQEIIQKITDKYAKMYEKFSGVENTRHVSITWYTEDKKEVVQKEDVIYKRYDDFYKDLVYKTLSYKVDGKKEDPSDYDPHESEPGIPIFDKNGAKEYNRTIVGYDTVNNQKCYKIRIDPKDPNTRHFKGHVWVTVDNLELILSEGTSGEMRFGCKDLYVRFQSKDFGDYYHFTKGFTRVNLSVLGIYRRVLEYRFENRNIKPMKQTAKQ